MNDRDNEADESGFGSLLREARPEPALPPRFQEGVWRRVEQLDFGTRTSGTASRLEHLVAGLLRPRLAVSGAIAMLLMGGIVGLMDGVHDANQAARDRYVASVAPTVLR